MKAYTKYKDSGVEWSPEIPDSWQARPVKALYDVQLGKMLQNDSQSTLDEKVPYLKALHVNWNHVEVNELPEMWASPQDVMQYDVKDNDLLVCEGGEVGRAGIVNNPPEKCIIQNALHRVRTKNGSNVKLLMYVLQAVKSADWFTVLCNKATIAHFTGEKFGELSIPVPTVVEQNIMVPFLDHKVIQIDDLIEKKERMIELLKEQRAAVINEAVTKGLDPNVKMKDSGVEWIGEVPEQWEAKRLKFICDLINQTGLPEDDSVKIDLENIESWTGKINLEVEEKEGEDKEIKSFKKGDVLFNKLRPYLAKVYLAQKEGFCGGELLVLRPNEFISSKFLFYRVISEAFINVVNGSTYGSKMPRASWDFIGNLRTFFPDFNTQVTIINYLEKQIVHIEGSIIIEEKSIEFLKEYRTSMISETVTGKIKVI